MRLSPLGPIFGVEMVTGARRLRFFVARGVYAFFLLLILLGNYSNAAFMYGGSRANLNIAQVSAFTSAFFYYFAILQIGAVLLVSPAALGSLVARERERRTIEYLFATDLTNREIVLGKFVAGWCYVGSLLLVGLPVLSLVMMLGGIPPQELLAVFIITLSTSVAVAALATLISVVSRRARDGVTQTYLALLFLLVAPLVFAWWLIPLLQDHYGGWLIHQAEYANQWLLAINPLYVMGNALINTGGRFLIGGTFAEIGYLVEGQLVGAAAALAIALVAVRRLHVRSAGKADLPKRTALRIGGRRTVGERAMLWKELFVERVAGRRGMIGRIALAVLVVVAVVATILVANSAWNDRTGDHEGMKFYTIGMSTVVSLAMMLIVGVRASTLVSSERERDTWTSLLCSPLSAAEILTAKVAGSLFAVRWVLPLQVLVWGTAGLLIPSFLLAVPFAAGTMAILLLFAATVGTFFSLWCRNTTRALLATLATAFVLGGGYSICCNCLMTPLFLITGFTGFGFGPFDEIAAMLMLVPLVPFLLGYPVAVGVYPADPSSDVEIPLAYLVGNGLYLLAALLILAFCHQRFARLAGRLDLAAPNLTPRAIASQETSV